MGDLFKTTRSLPPTPECLSHEQSTRMVSPSIGSPAPKLMEDCSGATTLCLPADRLNTEKKEESPESCETPDFKKPTKPKTKSGKPPDFKPSNPKFFKWCMCHISASEEGNLDTMLPCERKCFR